MAEHSNNEMRMEDGLDCYDPETRVFPKIAKAKTGQKLSKRDVLLILKWKLGRIRDANSETVADDKMDAINSAVMKGGESGCEIEAVEALDKIPGIGLAVATAILTVCYPDKFTIIDERVLEMLELFPNTHDATKQDKYRADDWTAKSYVEKYLPKVKAQSKDWDCSLRDADRALWGLSVSRRIEKVIAKTNHPQSDSLQS